MTKEKEEQILHNHEQRITTVEEKTKWQWIALSIIIFLLLVIAFLLQSAFIVNH